MTGTTLWTLAAKATASPADVVAKIKIWIDESREEAKGLPPEISGRNIFEDGGLVKALKACSEIRGVSSNAVSIKPISR